MTRRLLPALLALLWLSPAWAGSSLLLTGVGDAGGGGGGGGSASPVFYQHIATSTNPVGFGVAGYNPKIAVEALPPNTVAVLGVTVPQAASAVTISDTLVGSWSAALCNAANGTGNYRTYVFVQSLGATGGADQITIATGGTTNRIPIQAVVTFFQNAGAADGSLCTGAGGVTPNASGVITPGSFTPTTNNDANGGHIIWAYAALGSGTGSTTYPTGCSPASGYTLLNCDIAWRTDGGSNFPEASQWQTQTTNGATTPSFTMTGEGTSGDSFNIVVAAIKVVDNSATAPSSIHVASITHESSAAQTSPMTLVVRWPTIGNLRVATFTWDSGCTNGSPNGCLSGLTSSDNCSWTILGAGGAGGRIGYAQNCAPCPDCTLSLSFTGAVTMGQYSWREYDVVNAAASSFQNASTFTAASCGTTFNDAPDITPTGASSGLTIVENGNGNGPVTGFASGAPAGAVLDAPWQALPTTSGYLGSDADMADNSDASAHYYYSSLAAQTWNWTKRNGSDFCYYGAAAFN